MLKFFCWGSDGWKYKLSHYDEMMAARISEDGAFVSAKGVVLGPLFSCPVTLNEEVWEMYEKMFPSSVDNDSEGAKYGIDRSIYFERFFEHVKEADWTCYGGQQIAGFDTWMAEEYLSAVKYEEYMGVEAAVLEGGKSPVDYVKTLTDSANSTYKEYLERLTKAQD